MKHLDQLTLSLLVDEMLPKKTAEECLKHISHCPQCEQAYDDLLAMSFALAKVENVVPVDGFSSMKAGIMGNLPPQEEKDSEKVIEIPSHHVKPSFWAEVDFVQWGICVAGLVLVSSYLLSPNQEDSSLQNATSGSSQAPEIVLEDQLEVPMPTMKMEESGEEAVIAPVQGEEIYLEYDINAWYDLVEASPYVLALEEMTEGERALTSTFTLLDSYYPTYFFILKEMPAGTFPSEVEWTAIAPQWAESMGEGYASYFPTMEEAELWQEEFPELYQVYQGELEPKIGFYYNFGD